MMEFLVLAVVVAGLVGLARLVPYLLARFLVGVVGGAIGRHALAAQPDTIHLEKTGANAWQEPLAVEPLIWPLHQRGFHDAGVFRISEMPGITLQLLVKSDESLVAAIYEHPQAGHWIDLAARYQDGTSITFTTSQPTGLNDRPGHPIHNAPGLGVHALLVRARAEMPRRPLQQVTPFTAPRLFEHAYAESMADRKLHGISAREVTRVAEKMPKAA